MTKQRKKVRSDPATALARTIDMPRHQIRKGEFVVVDVANHTVADQRDMESLKRTKTIMRKPRLHKLYDAKIITLAQLKACQWYADRHSAGFDTVGITANYGGAGGGGCDAFTHLARHKEQMIARLEYDAARSAISPLLLAMFERVVVHGRPLGRLGISFRLAVGQLEDHLAGIGIGA